MPFAKGKSGNPGGRPKGNQELQAACQKMTPELLKTLYYWATQKQDPASAVKAASILLDRGYGKARQEMDISSAEGTPLIAVIRNG